MYIYWYKNVSIEMYRTKYTYYIWYVTVPNYICNLLFDVEKKNLIPAHMPLPIFSYQLRENLPLIQIPWSNG